MITSRQINVNLTRGKLKLRQVTTKDINPGIRVEPPKEPIKPRGVSTTTQADVVDIAEKKRRDDIAKEKKALEVARKKAEVAEKKLAMKDAKKIVIAEKPKLVDPSKELMAELTKKPWNKMNAKERKEYQIEKAKKEKK